MGSLCTSEIKQLQMKVDPVTHAAVTQAVLTHILGEQLHLRLYCSEVALEELRRSPVPSTIPLGSLDVPPGIPPGGNRRSPDRRQQPCEMQILFDDCRVGRMTRNVAEHLPTTVLEE